MVLVFDTEFGSTIVLGSDERATLVVAAPVDAGGCLIATTSATTYGKYL